MPKKAVVVKVKKILPFKKRAKGLLIADEICNFTAPAVSTPPRNKLVSAASTPDVVWVSMPAKFRAPLQVISEVVPIVDMPQLPETVTFQRSILEMLSQSEDDNVQTTIPQETDEQMRERVRLSKLHYNRNNWYADHGAQVDIDGGYPKEGEEDEDDYYNGFSYYPLALLPEMGRNPASGKDGPPCPDSCECFVGYDGSTGHNGLCYCVAIGTCVKCDDNVYYCLRCVNHTTHTRIAEDIAWCMTNEEV
jgi:hypothetical protein